MKHQIAVGDVYVDKCGVEVWIGLNDNTTFVAVMLMIAVLIMFLILRIMRD